MTMYFTILSFIMGIILGSFFNVCIYRIPEGISISHPPSHCYNCNTRLRTLDLVPILSWIFLKGKCRYCGKKISQRYALVELLSGVLFTMIYLEFGHDFTVLYYTILVSLLIIITFIDIDHYIIPNQLILIGCITSLIVNVLGYGVGVKNSIFAAAICGGGMLILTHLIELIVKKEVMGGGDIKLFTMTGLFLGIKGGILTILLSIYVGAIYGVGTIIYSKIKNKEYNSMIPYGPFISVGALITLLYGNNILSWYSSLFI